MNASDAETFALQYGAGFKSPGQLAYKADVALLPTYHDGVPRPPWHRLRVVAQLSWERDPTPRVVLKRK